MIIKKFVAAVTVGCFVVSFILRDAAAAVVEMSQTSASLDRMFGELVIPSGVGRITDSGYFGTDKVVIALQDLHCHPEVQRNIARLLTLLQKKYSFSKIYSEGASGTVDTGWLAGIKDGNLKKTLLESLVDRGRLTGEEYYSVLSNQPLIEYGIENEALQRENIVRLGKILERQPQYEAVIAGMRKKLAAAEQERFNRQNLRFNEMVARYRQGGMNAERYYTQLLKYAGKIQKAPDRFGTVYAISSADHPTINDYLELQKYGRHLNYRRVAVQLRQLMGDMKRLLPYAVYNRLMKETAEFSDQDELCLYLARIAKEKNLDIGGRYPELQRYFDYREKLASMNPVTLITEERRLLESIRIGLSEDMGELETGFLSEFMGCYEDYLKNRLVVEDYEYFMERFPRFQALWRKHMQGNDIEQIAADYPLLNEYYRVNSVRNSCFLNNILGNGVAGSTAAVMRTDRGNATENVIASLDRGSRAIVVVTGGFHTGGLTQLLKERGVSYLTITPNVTENAQFSAETYDALARRQARIMSNALRLVPLSAQYGPEQVTALVEALDPLLKNALTKASIDRVLQGIVEAWNTNDEVKKEREKQGDAGDLEYAYVGEQGGKGKHEIILRFTGTKRELHFTVDGARKHDRIRLDSAVETIDAQPAAPVLSDTVSEQNADTADKREVLRIAAISLAREEQQLEQKVLTAIRENKINDVEAIADTIGLNRKRSASRFSLSGKEMQFKDELKAVWNDKGETNPDEIIRLLNRYGYHEALLSYYKSYAEKNGLASRIEQQIKTSLSRQWQDEATAQKLLSDDIDWHLLRAGVDRANFAEYAARRYGEPLERYKLSRLLGAAGKAVKTGRVKGGIISLPLKAVFAFYMMGLELANSFFLRYPGSVIYYHKEGKEDVYLASGEIVRNVVDGISSQTNHTLKLHIPVVNLTAPLVDGENGWLKGERAVRAHRALLRAQAEVPYMVTALWWFLQSRAGIYFWTGIGGGIAVSLLTAGPVYLGILMTAYGYKLSRWAGVAAKSQTGDPKVRARQIQIFAAGTLVWIFPLTVGIAFMPLLSFGYQAILPVLASTPLAMFTGASLALAFSAGRGIRLAVAAQARQFFRFAGMYRQMLFNTYLFEGQLRLPTDEGRRGFFQDTGKFVPWAFDGATLIEYLENLQAGRGKEDAGLLDQEIAANTKVIYTVLYHDAQPLVRYRIVQASDIQKAQILKLLENLEVRAPSIDKKALSALKKKVGELGTQAEAETLLSREYWDAMLGNFISMYLVQFEIPVFLGQLDSIDSAFSRLTGKEIHVFKGAGLLLEGANADHRINETGINLYGHDGWFGHFVEDWGGLLGFFNRGMDELAVRYPVLNLAVNSGEVASVIKHGHMSPLAAARVVSREHRDFYEEVRLLEPDGFADTMIATPAAEVTGNMGNPVIIGTLTDMDDQNQPSTFIIKDENAMRNTTEPTQAVITQHAPGKAGEGAEYVEYTLLNGKVSKTEVFLAGGGTSRPDPSLVSIQDKHWAQLWGKSVRIYNMPTDLDIVTTVDLYTGLDYEVNWALSSHEIEHMPETWEKELADVMDKSDQEKIDAINATVARDLYYDHEGDKVKELWTEADNLYQQPGDGVRDWNAAADEYLSQGQKVPAICITSSIYYALLAKYVGLDAFVIGVRLVNEDGSLHSIDHAMTMVKVNGQWVIIDNTPLYADNVAEEKHWWQILFSGVLPAFAWPGDRRDLNGSAGKKKEQAAHNNEEQQDLLNVYVEFLNVIEYEKAVDIMELAVSDDQLQALSAFVKDGTVAPLIESFVKSLKTDDRDKYAVRLRQWYDEPANIQKLREAVQEQRLTGRVNKASVRSGRATDDQGAAAAGNARAYSVRDVIGTIVSSVNLRHFAEKLSLMRNISSERYMKAVEQLEAEEGSFNRSMLYLAAAPEDRKKAIAAAEYGNDRGVHGIAIVAAEPDDNAAETIDIETGEGNSLPVHVLVDKDALVFSVDPLRFETAAGEIVKSLNGFGKFGGDKQLLETIRRLYGKNGVFGDLEFDKIGFVPGVIVDYNGYGKLKADEKDVAYSMLLDNAVFVGLQGRDRRLEAGTDRRYDFVLEPDTAVDALLNIYFREAILRNASEEVMRGRTVIAEKKISAAEIPAGIGTYANELAEQNKDAAGLLLKSANGEYGGSFRKVIAALHKREQKVYGSFTAKNKEDIKYIVKQINDGGNKKEMPQRFDGAVINMTDADRAGMEELLDLLRRSVRSSALLVVMPPAGMSSAAWKYARDNGIFMNTNLTKLNENEAVQEMRDYDSGRIGAELDLNAAGRDRINRFFGQVLPQLPLQVLIVNTDELEMQLPSGILDNAWLKTSAIFKVLSLRRKKPEEIAADQKKLAFALKEKQLLGEQSLLPQYLDTVVQMRAWKEGDAAVAAPEAWREGSVVAYQMRKLEGNPKAQQILLEGVAARLLLIKEREAGRMERLKDGFADPALETMLAEALLERELLTRTGLWNVQKAQIQMDENVSAAVAVDNYVRERYDAMKAKKAQPQAIEELIAVIKLNAESKVMKKLEPVKEMNRAAYGALLSAA